MGVLIRRELKKYVRFPIYWIGIVLVFAGIVKNVGPYLQVHYFSDQKEIKEEVFPDSSDNCVMEGRIPSTPEQQKRMGDELIRQCLINEVKMDEHEVNQAMDEVKDMSIQETDRYMSEHWGFAGADFYYQYCEEHQGTVEEVNEYIRQRLEDQPFSYYFSMKFADFCGLYMGFFSIVLLAFLYLRDVKKDTYELLHTKPISAWQYVLGKIAGGFLAMAVPILLFNLIFYSMCLFTGVQNGWTIHMIDFVRVTVCYLLPNMLMVVCTYTIIAFVFHNPLPAFPLLVLYMIYSNMGSYGPDGRFDYYGRLFAIMVRFPGNLFEIAPPPMAFINQCYLVAASAVLILLSVILWKKKKNCIRLEII